MVGASARAKDQRPVNTATDTGDSRQARRTIPSPQALGGYTASPAYGEPYLADLDFGTSTSYSHLAFNTTRL
jgi:hypothetical protein